MGDKKHTREIFINDFVDNDCATYAKRIIRWNMEDIKKEVLEEDRIPIKIYINTYGGDSAPMAALIAAIQTSVVPVYTIGMGMCASAGAEILIAPPLKNRFIMPGTTVMFHAGKAGIEDNVGLVLDYAEYLRESNERSFEYISKQTKINKKKLDDMKLRDNWLFDTEAVQLGVVSKIVNSIAELPM